MKKSYLKIIFIFFCLQSFNLILGQEKEDYRITQEEIENNSITKFKFADIENVKQRNPIKRFNDDLLETQAYNNPLVIDSTSSILKKVSTIFEKKLNVLYGGKTLNLMFARKLATNFNSSNDLTLQRSYFNVDAAEKSFSLGYNFDNRDGDPLKQLNWVASIGAKVVASNDFATIATGSDLEENNIGFNLKFSYIYNGRIGWKTTNRTENRQSQQQKEKISIFEDQSSIVESHREFLNFKYDKKVKDFNANEIDQVKKQSIGIYGSEKGDSMTKSKIEKKSDQLLYEMIEEEINFIESNNLYTTLINSWWTLETYIPVGDIEYNITPINSDNKATEVSFYPFNVNVSYNIYREMPQWFSYFAKFTGIVKGNSNINVDNLKAKEFQSIMINEGVPTLTSPVSAIEVSEFDRFITTSLKAELAFFFNNWIGFSPSLEKNFGTYDGLNWKLGIPFSLKDKEGKPTVNFELQWRENKRLSGSDHLFGFSTSFFFGNLIGKG